MRILVSTDFSAGGGQSHPESDSPRVRPTRPRAHIGMATIDCVRAAGGMPLLLAPGEPRLEELLSYVDGVVITGGNFDIHPRHYGESAIDQLGEVKESRTDTELELAKLCLERGIPVLGVCGGMQAMAVVAGATLYQDIGTQVTGALEHEQPTDPAQGWHLLHTHKGILGHLLGERPVVNSTHHQSVRDPGQLRVSATAPDGVIEAIELPNHPFAIGVQWHPELLDHANRIYGALVDAARARRKH